MRDRLCAGHAQIGNDHPIPPFSPFYHSELPVRAYDPDRAKSNRVMQAVLQMKKLDIAALERAAA